MTVRSFATPLLFASAALPFALGAQSPVRAAGGADTISPQVVTLDQAVAMAQRSAPATVQARGDVATSTEGVRAARAAFLPNLTLSASRTYQGGDLLSETGSIIPFRGRSWRSGDALSASVPLFDAGGRAYTVRNARATLQGAQANETTQQFTVAFQVKQAYFSALAAREAEAAALAQLQQAQEQARVANAQVALRVSTVSDSLRATIQVIDAQAALLTARNDLAGANALLTRLTASLVPVTADPADTVRTGAVTVDSATLLALAERGPAVQQASAQQAAASAALGSARSAYWPQVDASVSLSGNGFDPYYGIGTPYAYGRSFRLTVSYPLFDQLQRQDTRLRAAVAQTNAEATLRDTRLAARQQGVQLIGTLQLDAQQLALQQASVRAAQEDLRVVQRRYELHMATLLDVLTSQTALTQARTALIQARYNYRITKAQLETLVGRSL